MQALAFLLEIAATLYGGLVLARLLLQLVRGNFYNPIAQFILRATSPMLLPLRRVIPPIGRFDTAALVLLFLVMLAYVSVLFLLAGAVLNPVTILIRTGFEVLLLVIGFYTLTLIGQAILSFLGPQMHGQPLPTLLYQLNQPLLAPLQRVLPTFSGIDFSPMVALIGLHFVKLLLLGGW